MSKTTLDKLLDTFSDHTKDPKRLENISEDLSNDLKRSLKQSYDYTKQEEPGKELRAQKKSLKTLIIDGFDYEQIWQQIELQNDEVFDEAVKDFTNLLISKKQLVFNSLNDQLLQADEESSEENEEDANPIGITDDDDDDDDDESDADDLPLLSDADEKSRKSKTDKGSQKGSIVDDEFFKLSEMEKFLENEEKEKKPKKEKIRDDSDEEDDDDDDDDEGSIDLFEEDEEDKGDEVDEARMAKFKDYFVAKEDSEPKRKTNKLMKELDEADDNDDSESEPEDEEQLLNDLKSTLEMRQERLQRKIEDLEEQAVSDKPWQLKGEITAEKRPQNSLLEEIVEFDLTSRPAPVITEQSSLQLEDIIRQRIKHKTFDSVEKISRPVETALEFKKKLVLDQEKSKQSLAQIYEKEFLDQKAALEQDPMDVQEEEPESYKEVKKLMKNLFTKLDALSNFHFTTTAAIPELKIVSNLPAINMEEVAPVAASDAALLAPEEIKNKPKGDLIGKNEKTSTDKKRERRKKKLKQKIHSKRKAKIESAVAKKKNRVKA